MYLLSADAEDDAPGPHQRYLRYLRDNESRFPRGAFELATSDWYFDSRDHRCPHDAWLEWITLEETGHGARGQQRYTSLTVRLLGAYHDGYIELHYPKVYAYQLDCASGEKGHRDWVNDEFRLDERGLLIHEIEWMGSDETARWKIVASDVVYSWIPRQEPRSTAP